MRELVGLETKTRHFFEKEAAIICANAAERWSKGRPGQGQLNSSMTWSLVTLTRVILVEWWKWKVRVKGVVTVCRWLFQDIFFSKNRSRERGSSWRETQKHEMSIYGRLRDCKNDPAERKGLATTKREGTDFGFRISEGFEQVSWGLAHQWRAGLRWKRGRFIYCA